MIKLAVRKHSVLPFTATTYSSPTLWTSYLSRNSYPIAMSDSLVDFARPLEIPPAS